MNWFFHNPVADMPGPLFLCFYALVLTGAYLLGRWRLWDRDKTDELPSLRIPSVPDAYTTAYLADGSAGLRDTVLTS
ncbi:MAG: hypothetical protein RLZZ142_217, partial [Verrucomicrobiota bacterium]